MIDSTFFFLFFRVLQRSFFYCFLPPLLAVINYKIAPPISSFRVFSLSYAYRHKFGGKKFIYICILNARTELTQGALRCSRGLHFTTTRRQVYLKAFFGGEFSRLGIKHRRSMGLPFTAFQVWFFPYMRFRLYFRVFAKLQSCYRLQRRWHFLPVCGIEYSVPIGLCAKSFYEGSEGTMRLRRADTEIPLSLSALRIRSLCIGLKVLYS